MSVETGVLSVLIKFVWLPVVGFLGWIGSTYFSKLEERLDEAEQVEKDLNEKIVGLEKDLIKNYFDKQEISENIYKPLNDKMQETQTELKVLSGMITDIHSDMAILKYKILGEELNNQ